MKVAFGCDPNAMEMKKELIHYLSGLGHECEDFGSEDSVYANVAIKVAKLVAKGIYERGILICGTGIGVSIAANKVKGAYAALVTDTYQAKRAQLSNKANIIALGAQVTGIESAKCLVNEYLSQVYDSRSRSASKIQRIYDYEVEE